MARKYKAIIITDTYVGIPGGSERHLLTFLSNSDEAISYDVYQMIPTGNPYHGDGALSSSANVTLHSCPVEKVASFSYLMLLCRILIKKLRGDMDIIIAYHEKSEILAYIVKNMWGKKVITVCSKRDMGFKLSGRLESLIKKISHSWDLITCPSQAIKEWLITDYDVDTEKVSVVSNGVNLRDYDLASLDQSALREQFNITAPQVILNIGCLKPVKGHGTLLQAFSHFLKISNNQTQLVLLGEGPDEDALRAMAENLGITEQVLFLGYQTNIPEWMALASLVVSSSESEGLSNALIEACAAGKPIVATRVGGNPEVVSHNFNGLLVEPSNPVAMSEAFSIILNDANRALEMSKSARNVANSKFSALVMAEKLNQEYIGLIQEHAISKVTVEVARERD